METFSEEFPDIFWGKVNVDENSELIKKYEIQSIPTLIAFLNQEEVSRRSGKASDVELHDFIKKLGYSILAAPEEQTPEEMS